MEAASVEISGCQQCGQPTPPRRRYGRAPKWCSPACANKAYRRRKNPNNYGPKPCAVCSVVFERVYPSKHKRTCSNECASKLSYRENKTTRDAKTNEWHRAHKDRLLGYVAISRAKKPEYYRALRVVTEARRRAKFNGSYTVQEWNDLKIAHGNKCLRCAAPESERPLTADHIIPVSCGGPNVISNIQPLCRPCNTWKHVKTIDYRIAA